MPFTKEESEAWHRAKLQRAATPQPTQTFPNVGTCVHCGQPFSYANGTLYDEFGICDACDRD